ncbi:MAG: hypothetical protein FJ148_25580 [Deltaproteobacteria bacterium]|nr:hypothetical protein [Deltaproteobacteria bacterium]
MAEVRDDCARCRSLLTRMDHASAHALDDDPAAVLAERDLDWLAGHLASCAACAPDASLLASVGTLLRADELPDDDFFAARRGSLLATIGASADDADGGVVGAGAPARAAGRPALRAISGTGARSVRGSSPVRRHSIWQPLVPALAAGLAIAVALGALLARSPRPQGIEVTMADGPAGDPVAALDAESADDSWIIASNDPFALALASRSDPALDALSNEDLDEVEAILVPSPGWS